MTSVIEVTQSNFDVEFPNICRHIESCSFYAVDCEFTGLKNDHFSLFDSPKERYHKAKECIKDFFIPQFGLSTFTHIRGANTFESATYSFYLLPVSKDKFQCGIGTIEFFTSHGFNWQALFTDGLNYLSWADEKSLVSKLEAGTLQFDLLSDLQFYYQDELKVMLAKVSAWSETNSEGDLDLEIPCHNPYFIYLLSKIIPQRFPGLRTTRYNYNHVKVSRERHRRDKKENPDAVIQEFFLGFSKVWKVLIASKKPMVGHNMFMDLVMMYQQFIGPLPGNYGSYKLALNRIFPVIFDTKHICFELRRLVPREKEWPTDSMENLFNFFRTDPFLSAVMLQPAVKPIPEGNFHNAGFDAFSSGFCFTRFSYLLCIWSKHNGKFSYPMIPVTCTELLAAISIYANCINVIRGQVSFVRLDSSDPVGKRPDILLVEYKNYADLIKLRSMLECYSCVDQKFLSRNRLLLAIGSFSVARQIQRSLHSDSNIKVARYNRFLHDRNFQLTGIVSVCLATMLFALLRLR